MYSKMRKIDQVKKKSKSLFSKIVFSRTILIGISLISQALILFATFAWFSRYTHYIYGGFTVLSAIVIIIYTQKLTNSLRLDIIDSERELKYETSNFSRED